MLIIPAIDLKDAKVVRLYQGKKNFETIYSTEPCAVALYWQKQGAELIHVVDLDGAFCGEPKNLSALQRIIQAVSVPIQFGGGVRTKEAIKKILALGVARVVLGTRAAEDEDFLKEAIAEFKNKVIVTIDAREELVLTEGWQTQNSQLKVLDFAQRLEKLGLSKIIYTDTSRDGTLSGPNLEALDKILKNTRLEIIASGGVSSIQDLTALRQLDPKRIIGAIVGKALYEEKFTLKAALNLA